MVPRPPQGRRRAAIQRHEGCPRREKRVAVDSAGHESQCSRCGQCVLHMGRQEDWAVPMAGQADAAARGWRLGLAQHRRQGPGFILLARNAARALSAIQWRRRPAHGHLGLRPQRTRQLVDAGRLLLCAFRLWVCCRPSRARCVQDSLATLTTHHAPASTVAGGACAPSRSSARSTACR